MGLDLVNSESKTHFTTGGVILSINQKMLWRHTRTQLPGAVRARHGLKTVQLHCRLACRPGSREFVLFGVEFVGGNRIICFRAFRTVRGVNESLQAKKLTFVFESERSGSVAVSSSGSSSSNPRLGVRPFPLYASSSRRATRLKSNGGCTSLSGFGVLVALTARISRIGLTSIAFKKRLLVQ